MGVRSSEVEAETVALAPDGLDTHHGTNGGIVLCSRVGNHLDALDFVTLQALEFTGIGHATAVDIDQRAAPADNFQAVLALDEARRARQDIIGRSHVLQHGAADVGLQAFAGELGLGHDGGSHGAFQHGGVVQEGDYHAIHRSQVYGPVAQHGHHHDAIVFTCYYIKGTVLFSDSTAYYCGIGLGEYGHVCVGHRLTVLVHYLTFPILLGAGRKSGQNHHQGNNQLLHVTVLV